MDNRRRAFLKLSLLAPLVGHVSIDVVTAAMLDSQLTEKSRLVLGKKMTYLTAGDGDPIIFFHGNPTRAYLWRNVIPHVQKQGTCFAPDLIGMGNSEKLGKEIEDRYTFSCHVRFLENLLEKLIPKRKKAIVVGHDWGGVLAIDWARRHAERVKGIAFMETFLEPHKTGSTPQVVIDWFRNFGTEKMEKEVLENNHFVENVFFRGLKDLSEKDKEVYRQPYKNQGEDRLPTLVWPRQVPIDGSPESTDKAFTANMNFMAASPIPKLFINADPGALLGNEGRRSVIRQWPNLTEVKVKGNHYIQEQSPNEIGLAISSWLSGLEKK